MGNLLVAFLSKVHKQELGIFATETVLYSKICLSFDKFKLCRLGLETNFCTKERCTLHTTPLFTLGRYDLGTIKKTLK